MTRASDVSRHMEQEDPVRKVQPRMAPLMQVIVTRSSGEPLRRGRIGEAGEIVGWPSSEP